MAKSWTYAKNIYGVVNWIKTVNEMTDKGEIDGIMLNDVEAPIGRWNKKCYLTLSSNYLSLAVPKSNLYWGVIYEFKPKNKEAVYKALKGLIYKLPILCNSYSSSIEPRENGGYHEVRTVINSYTYLKYDSKLKLLERALHYDPDRKTSESCT